MPRRQDHSHEQIRQLAVEAAHALLRHDGVQALSARAVARHIGYTVGTLYNVFTDFNDLVLHVNAHTMDQLSQQFTRVQHKPERNHHPYQTINRLTTCYVDFALDHPAAWSLLFDPRFHANPPLPAWYQQKIDGLFAQISQELLPLTNSATLAQTAAQTLWACLYGICQLSINQKLERAGIGATDELAHQLVGNYLNGLINSSLQST